MPRSPGFAILIFAAVLAPALAAELPAGGTARLADDKLGELHALAFVDEGTLAIGHDKGCLRWRIATDERPPSPEGVGPIYAIARHDQRLWLGGAKKLYDMGAPLTDLKHSRELDANRVSLIAVSRDGSRLVHSRSELILALRDAKTSDYQGDIEFASKPIAATFCGNGRILGVVTRDGAARVYYLSPKGALESMWTKRVARSEHGAAAFSPDGRLLAVASAGRVLVLESMTGRQLVGLERKFGEGDVRSLAFSPDGRMIATGNQKVPAGKVALEENPRGIIRVWAAETGDLLATFDGNQGDVKALAFAPDGRSLASAGSDRSVLVWNVPTAPKGLEPLPLSDAWNELDALDAATAHRAQASFLADRVKSVEVIRLGLLGIAAEQQQIRQWVAQLDHDKFRVREAARRNLAKRGLRAAAVLSDPKRESLLAEGEQSVRLILEEMEAKGVRTPESGLYGEPLRIVRAVRLLELLGGPEAQAILIEAAKESDPRLAKEAKSALALWK